MKEVKIINPDSPYFGKKGLAKKTDCGLIVFIDGKPDWQIFWPQEIEVTGNATVYEATHLAFNRIRQNEFSVFMLLNSVRSICEREALMDSTILRRLRELREDGKINYELADSLKSKYRKL